MSLTVGSLFSGVGGLDYGLERAGMAVRWQCEIDDFARRVLAKHWPDVKQYGDIRELTGHELERVDCIAGGAPCQPVSVAGKRRGKDDDRWLWPEFARLVRVLRPRYVLVENTPGLLVRGLGDVLGDLAACGYDAEWAVLSAAQFGASHLRRRIFVVAYSSSVGRYAPADAGGLLGKVLPAQTQRPGCEVGRKFERGIGGRIFGFPHTPLLGVDDGFPAGMDRDRVKALGNAVVPQVGEWIGNRILGFVREVEGG